MVLISDLIAAEMQLVVHYLQRSVAQYFTERENITAIEQVIDGKGMPAYNKKHIDALTVDYGYMFEPVSPYNHLMNLHTASCGVLSPDFISIPSFTACHHARPAV